MRQKEMNDMKTEEIGGEEHVLLLAPMQHLP